MLTVACGRADEYGNPMRKSRSIIALSVVLLTGTGAALLSVGLGIIWFSHRTADRLILQTVGSSFAIESLAFDRVVFGLRSGVVYRRVRGRALLGGESVFRSRRSVTFQIDRALIRPVGFVPPRVAIDLEGISAIASPVGGVVGEKLAPAEILEQGRGRIVLDGPPKRPADWVRNSLSQFLRQAIEGKLPEGSRLSGRVEFPVGNRWHSARLFTLVSREGTRLVLNRDDVAGLGAEYDQPLTETEIDLVALYPLRAPVLLRIKDRASCQSARLSRTDAAFPRDAYRHVLWSYLLTREFGETFAEQVTDAHEIGATYESGIPSRNMDLANNAVGRRYARLGLEESELPGRVLNDPAVVWRPLR